MRRNYYSFFIVAGLIAGCGSRYNVKPDKQYGNKLAAIVNVEADTGLDKRRIRKGVSYQVL